MILALVYFFSPSLHGENKPFVDSLRQELMITRELKSRVKLLNELAWELKDESTNESRAYLKQVFILSKGEVDLEQSRSEAFICLAIIQRNQGTYDSAYLNLEEALAIRQIRKDFNGIASVYNNYAAVYDIQGRYDKAIEYYLRATELLEDFAPSTLLWQIYSNLSAQYFWQEDYAKGIRISHKQEQLIGKLAELPTDEFFRLYVNIAVAYWEQDSLSEAQTVLQKAIPLYDSIQAQELLITYHNLLGLLASEYDQQEKSKLEFEKAIALSEKYDLLFEGIEPQINLARAFLELGQINNALAQAEKALALAKEYKQTPLTMEAYRILFEIYEKQGDNRSALRYYKAYQAIEDTLLNEQKLEIITRLEVEKVERENDKLMLEKTQQDLDISEKDNRILLLDISIITILALFAMVWFLLSRKRRIEKNRYTNQIENLVSQHRSQLLERLYQTQEEERMRIASQLHDEVGAALGSTHQRLSLFAERKQLTDELFTRSLGILKDVMKVTRQLSHRLFKKTLEIGGIEQSITELAQELSSIYPIEIRVKSMGVEVDSFSFAQRYFIYQIIESLLQNVLQHAAANKAEVELILSDKDLKIVVHDDGIGFDPKNLNDKEHGFGLKSIQSRIKEYQGEIAIDSQKNKGTKVSIKLNLKPDSTIYFPQDV